MDIEIVEQWAKDRGFSAQDALQSFLQVMVLKNLSLAGARLIGGTALVLGHGNPRFSEDLDFANVAKPTLLERDIQKAVREINGWLKIRGRIVYPKPGKHTWRIVYQLLPTETIQLHIDADNSPVHTHFPMVIQFPGIPPFIKESVDVDEIMANKIVALAQRNYLSGRDLFDLWFHWLSQGESPKRTKNILNLLKNKLKEQGLSKAQLLQTLNIRLGSTVVLDRAQYEWKRYLTAPFQKSAVFENILKQAKRLLLVLAP